MMRGNVNTEIICIALELRSKCRVVIAQNCIKAYGDVDHGGTNPRTPSFK